MRILKSIACAASLCLSAYTPIASAQLTTYVESFEGYLLSTSSDPLKDLAFVINGWQGFLLNTDLNDVPRFPGVTIGPPNGANYTAIADDEPGPTTGSRYANLFSDYACCSPGVNNWGHFAGTDNVETFVFQEQTIGSGDVGKTYTFYFDAKRPSDESGTAVNSDGKGGIARAFIKTLDPNASFAQTNIVEIDMSSISQEVWSRYSISIDLSDPLLDGQVLQFGFYTKASDFARTGVYYDNLVFADATLGDVDTFNIPVPFAALLSLAAALVLAGRRATK